MIVYRVNLNVDGLTNLRGYTGIYVFRPSPANRATPAARYWM